MRKTQASLSALCAAVLVIAVNMSLLRQVMTEDNSAIAGAIGILVMVNLLAVESGRILARRGRVLPRRIGFVVGGSLAVLTYLACCQLFPDAIEELLLSSIILPIHAFCTQHLPTRLMRDFDDQVFYAQALLTTGLIPTVALVLALPQFLIALCGSWVGMKLIRSDDDPSRFGKRMPVDHRAEFADREA